MVLFPLINDMTANKSPGKRVISVHNTQPSSAFIDAAEKDELRGSARNEKTTHK